MPQRTDTTLPSLHTEHIKFKIFKTSAAQRGSWATQVAVPIATSAMSAKPMVTCCSPPAGLETAGTGTVHEEHHLLSSHCLIRANLAFLDLPTALVVVSAQLPNGEAQCIHAYVLQHMEHHNIVCRGRVVPCVYTSVGFRP